MQKQASDISEGEEYSILVLKEGSLELAVIGSINSKQVKSKARNKYNKTFAGVEGETIEEIVLNKAREYSVDHSEDLIIVKKLEYVVNWMALPQYGACSSVALFKNGKKIL